MPTVSIIVPFKDAEEFLKRCISNLERQNYEDYEIILINDNEEFDLKETKQQFTIKKRTDPKLGVGKARNLGIEKSKGKYIMFVDVDDFIDEDLISKLEPFMKQEIDIIKYKMRIKKDEDIREADGPVFDVTTGEDAFNKLCFEDKYLDSPCIYLIRKEYFEQTGLKFPENMYHEDFGLIPLIIVKAKTVVSTKYFGYTYMQTENSIMRNNDYNRLITKVENKFEHYNNMLKIIETWNLNLKTKENIKQYYTNSVIMSLKDLKKEDRKKFENKIKQLNMIDNIKVTSFKQLIKKIILKLNIEIYLKWKGF